MDYVKLVTEELNKHTAVDLSHLKSKMKEYSHGPNHKGYIDDAGTSGITHPELHKKATEAGYRYTRKLPSSVDGKETTYHSYTKNGGPYSDHHLTIATRGKKVWTVEHKTVKDNS
jgi:hypothetical protein